MQKFEVKFGLYLFIVNEIICLPYHTVQLPPPRCSYICIITLFLCVFLRYHGLVK